MEMSRVTSKYQATVPADVRAALGVKAGDCLGWEVRDGVATVRRVANVAPTSPVTVVDHRVFAEWLSDEDIEDWG
ncbi:MAG: AbrB/MazE/SpoVT family DNA-binding domain-containing protein [Sphingomonadaceae bacterium]